MKFIIAILLLCATSAFAQPSRLPPPPDWQRPHIERPQFDRGQRQCRYLFRLKNRCEDRRCERRMDRRIRECMSR